jgi:putative DNA primase/helicase
MAFQQKADELHDSLPEDGETAAGSANGLVMPLGFSFKDSGLWYKPPPRKEGEAEPAIWVCARFNISARTSDDTHHGHGLLLDWIDADGVKHKWAMPLRLAHAEGSAIAGELHDAGLRCGTSRKAHELLKQFLGAVTITRHVRCVDRAGWHDTVYVLPNGLRFGDGSDNIVLQTERATTSGAYAVRGTLTEWRDSVARYAVGNDLLAFTISGSFGAALLDIIDAPSGGEHFHGSSRIGKTTLLRGAISVWGPSDGKLMRTWRVTANGLEAVAAETNDGMLFLDEIKQANARDVGDVIYTLAGGVGKARANRIGLARPSHVWRTSFQSTGEMTLAQKLAEANLRPYAGQDVRMIHIPADAGAGFGVWQTLHGFSSGAALADHLYKTTRTCCGTAGSAYLEQLARERAEDSAELTTTLRILRQQFLDAHVPSDANGQVRSVADRFALNAAAGELATVYEVTGWPEGEAFRAAGACFKRWLETRGGTGAAEEMQATERVRAFIFAHGSSRFELAGAPPGHSLEAGESPVNDDTKSWSGDLDQKIINRAGWKLSTKEGVEYLITPDCWNNEICRGCNSKLVADVVAKAGFQVCGSDGRRTVKKRIAPHGPVRGYLVRGAILGGDDNGK